MSSAKTERLVNLTMALLASRRFMTKSEIFRRVSGYSGSQETKERMFERDKDDLRNLGIEIEVGGHDPLFEDEPGYRILPERYQLPAQSFDSEELGLIAVALDLWSGSQAQDSTENMLRRFLSLGVDVNIPQGLSLGKVRINEEGLVELTGALAQRKAIRFTYAKSGSQNPESREVHPFGLTAWRGAWYLVGEDLSKNEVRAFKLSRIHSQIQVFGAADAYEIPSDFDVRDYLIMFSKKESKAELQIRKNQAISIRNRAEDTSHINDEWDRVTLVIEDEISLTREILSFGDSIVVDSPNNLRESVIQSLKKVIEVYG